MHLNYQDPDAGVFYSSGYDIKGIYIYTYIISDVNEKAISVIIRSRHSANFMGVDGSIWLRSVLLENEWF